ncbi:MAG TPA: M15 family metallopeptidase [Candidatus Angelobacter sp.]|nr:M15 family metallopeptidase [Candidatus Angelobacter sp.]
MDSISEQRLAGIFPVLADRVRSMAAALEKQGVEIRVVQALRTCEEQDALFAQGRTAPGKVVTNCCGGKSYHNFGLAVDLVPSINGVDQTYVPDWNREHPTWQKMIAAGAAEGLNAGATWRTFPDYPHFQLTGQFPVGAPSDEVRELFKTGGLAAVWAEVKKSLTLQDQQFEEKLRSYLHDPVVPLFRKDDGSIDREKTLSLPCYADLRDAK